MGPVSVSAQIEILAKPETVRAIFLNFARYNEWHQGWEVTTVAPANPSDLKVGDQLKVKMHGMRFSPRVGMIDSNHFLWEGTVPGILTGKHYFDFIPSMTNPGGTTFIQHEEFTGPVTYLYYPWRNKEHQPSENWKHFNECLKKEAEKQQSA